MLEIRFNEKFENGELTVHLSGELTSKTYNVLSEAMERIRKQLVSLIAPQPITAPGGVALDTSAFTTKIPGIDPTDRRRGPRVKKTARRK